jgi:proteasome assembly chaperone (PAC2) family protein
MGNGPLKLVETPALTDATLLVALTGWMDGGSVSTGTVKQLMGMGRRTTRSIGSIEDDGFYIYNFPGDMETSALFRPHVVYDDGVVTTFELPTNTFYCNEPANLVFFTGKEPNLRWQEFADCIFDLVKAVGVSRIIFMGSFGGAVPHTREPRLYGSVSDPKLRPLLEQYHLKPSEYEGPGSFATLLLHDAAKHGVEMLSIVAEIPGYLQGMNPLSIEAISRRLSSIINVPIDLDALRTASNEWETQVTEAVGKDEELGETIRKLEEDYDNELLKDAE